MLPNFPLRTAVACHDAGAANIIIACLLETGRKDWQPYMEGPAEKLWKASFPEIKLRDSLEEALDGSELLVTGTGWESNVEHEARILAQKRGVKSVAIIDHWDNYAERFVRQGKVVWPNEFWVTDQYALEHALRVFPEKSVIQIPNHYVIRQLRDIALVEKASEPELLYVLEPMRADWGRGTPGEFQALDFFIDQFSELGFPAETVIRLRPHPSDALGKYNHWIDLHPEINIKLDTSLSITESLGRATWVAGCESFALVLAMIAGRKVYCTLPPWAPPCRLPHGGLIKLGRSGK